MPFGEARLKTGPRHLGINNGPDKGGPGRFLVGLSERHYWSVLGGYKRFKQSPRLDATGF